MALERVVDRITRYGCMANVRRKFVEALQTDSRVVGIINKISELYWIESDCKIHMYTPEERQRERKRRSLLVIADLWQMIKPIFDETRNYSTNLFVKAVRYAVSEGVAGCRYVNNGIAEIDNNAAERMMKRICLGRKNYLFCASEQGARNASLVYSIIETCKINERPTAGEVHCRGFKEISGG